MSGGDPYEQLKRATPEQLVDAYIWEIDNQTDMPDDKKRLMKRYLRIGFQLAQADGWERVAPHWLRMSLQESECPCDSCEFGDSCIWRPNTVECRGVLNE